MNEPSAVVEVRDSTGRVMGTVYLSKDLIEDLHSFSTLDTETEAAQYVGLEVVRYLKKIGE